jgi:hypothetical protein
MHILICIAKNIYSDLQSWGVHDLRLMSTTPSTTYAPPRRLSDLRVGETLVMAQEEIEGVGMRAEWEAKGVWVEPWAPFSSSFHTGVREEDEVEEPMADEAAEMRELEQPINGVADDGEPVLSNEVGVIRGVIVDVVVELEEVEEAVQREAVEEGRSLDGSGEGEGLKANNRANGGCAGSWANVQGEANGGVLIDSREIAIGQIEAGEGKGNRKGGGRWTK